MQRDPLKDRRDRKDKRQLETYHLYITELISTGQEINIVMRDPCLTFGILDLILTVGPKLMF